MRGDRFFLSLVIAFFTATISVLIRPCVGRCIQARDLRLLLFSRRGETLLVSSNLMLAISMLFHSSYERVRLLDSRLPALQ